MTDYSSAHQRKLAVNQIVPWVAAARKMGKVAVDMGDTACKVPDAESYMVKCRRGAAVAPKRKTVRC